MRASLRGQGLREQLLRLVGAGFVYDRVRELETECGGLKQELATASIRSATTQAPQPEPQAESQYLLELRRQNRVVVTDFPVRPRVRFGWDLPPNPHLATRLHERDDRYAETLSAFLPLLPSLAEISLQPSADAEQPHWMNLSFNAADAIALYGLLTLHRPRRFIEIGSGFSTRFARRAIRDQSLPTRITSIDPEPRAEIDAICDDVVRCPLEDAPASAFADITEQDLVFIDGSHRVFQGSDATVFFTEVLPGLPSGTLIGVHDIFLPADYPPQWLDWYLSEQYLVACWLLGGDRMQVELPMYHIGLVPRLHEILSPFWQHPALTGVGTHGGAFFFRLRH